LRPPKGDDVRASSLRKRAPGSYVLGAPISLADFLALPEDRKGLSYDRDGEGRLTLTSPEDGQHHRTPLGRLLQALYVWAARKRQPYTVLPEPEIVLDPVFRLGGQVVPESFLGPRVIKPDIACFAGEPRYVRTPEGSTRYSKEGLLLVVEIASTRTWRQDLGKGEADAVDRWRTYLENRVPEYWFLNVGVDACRDVPTGSGMFLAHDPEAFTFASLPVTREKVETDYRSLSVLRAGRVQSQALPGFVLDLGKFFRRPKG
jgi:Uma2 family endonuclease